MTFPRTALRFTQWLSIVRPVLLSLAVAIAGGAHADADWIAPSFPEKLAIDSPQTKRDSQGNWFEDIDPFMGNLRVGIPLFNIPSNGGIPLSAQWVYNAQEPQNTGINYWRVRFPQQQVANATPPAVLEKPDGSSELLFPESGTYMSYGSSTWRSTTNFKLSCGANAMGCIGYSPDGSVYTFGQSFSLASTTYPILKATPNATPSTYAVQVTNRYAAVTDIMDRHGNHQAATYNGNGQLTSLTNQTDGNQILVAYDGYGFLSSVTAGNRSWQFNGTLNNYNLYNALTITRPDGLQWQLDFTILLQNQATQYNMLTQVTNPYGGTTSYQYSVYRIPDLDELCPGGQGACYLSRAQEIREASRPVLWQKTTSDGGTWTLQEFQSPSMPAPGSATAGVRHFVTPSGTITYKYATIYDGVCTPWQIGLLLSKDIGLQQESYTWTPLPLTAMQQYAFGPLRALDADAPFTCIGSTVNAPFLASKTITRDGKSYSVTSVPDSYGRATQTTEVDSDGTQRVISTSYASIAGMWKLDAISGQTMAAMAGGAVVSSFSRLYDGVGNLTSETRNNVTTAYGYDAQGNLSSITSPRGLVTTFGNYYRGVARSVTKPVRTGSDPASCTPADVSATWVSTVDDFGNTLSTTDPLQHATSYSYDALDRLTGITPPQGNATRISFSANSKTLVRGNHLEASQYDGFGRAISQQIDDRAVSTRYDTLGRVVFRSYPNSGVGDTSAYDAIDRITSLTHSDGSMRVYGYTGSAVAERNERGNTSSWFYRAWGDPDQKFLTMIVPPAVDSGSAVVNIARNLLGEIQSVNQNNVTRNWGYDSHHYLTSRTDPEIGTTTYGRDIEGNLTSRQVGSQPVASFYYDAQNRLLLSHYADGTTPDSCHRYDAAGRESQLNNSQASRSYSYDSNSNLIAETLAANGSNLSLAYGYDGNDARSSLTYPDGHTIALNPDASGRATVLGSWVSAIQYDSWGHTASWNDANGRVSSYTFTDRGMPLTAQVNSGNQTLPTKPVAPVAPTPPAGPPTPPGAAPIAPATPTAAQPGVSITADAACRALYDEPRLSDFNGPNGQSSTGQYNTAHAQWVAQYNSCVPDWNGKGVTWSNGQAGCRVSYPQPRQRDFATSTHPFDAYNYAVSVWQPKLNSCVSDWTSRSGVWVTYWSQYATYQNQLAGYQSQQANYQSQLANYQSQLATYQAQQAAYVTASSQYQQALANYNNAVASLQLVQAASYVYDAGGNLTSVVDDAYPLANRSYGYDGMDRLVTANAGNGWGTGSLGYDANGNVSRQSYGSWFINYAYDATQRLIGVSGNKNYALSYDGWGNVTSRGDGIQYQYDNAGNLKTVNPGAASQIAYGYDGAGVRTTSNSSGQNRLEFTGRDGLLYYEIDLASNTVTDHLYLAGHKLVDLQGSSVTYYHNDIVGSPIAATDASGAILWHASYQPFGDKAFNAGAVTPIQNRQWFTGKPTEEATGLQYFGARWYDPVLGRFMAMDPVDFQEANAQSFNRYAYGNNNPFRFVDPDGKEPGDGATADTESARVAGRGRESPSALAEMIADHVNPSQISKAPGFGENMDGLGPSDQLSSGEHNVENIKGGVAKTTYGTRIGDFTKSQKNKAKANSAEENGGTMACADCGRPLENIKNEKGKPTPDNQAQVHHEPSLNNGGSRDSKAIVLCPGCHVGRHANEP